MSLFDQRIEINHFDVGMESFQHSLPTDSCWERGECCKHGSLRHIEKCKALIMQA